MLKLHTITSDGSTGTGEPITITVINPETHQPMEGVTITLDPATPKEWRELQKKHRKPEVNPATRGVDYVVDTDAACDALLSVKIRGWSGIIGADDKPLPVLPAVIERLDPRVKAQAFGAVLGAEFTDSPEVRAASFREPA